MNKKIVIIALAVSLMLAIGVGLGACSPQNQSVPTVSAAGYLELGEKHLLEMSYEQALVQFLSVIELEPMNPRGYTGAAAAYVALGDTESAIAILQQGLLTLPGNNDITMILNTLLGDDLSDMQLYLRELLAKYEEGGYESIYDAVSTEEYVMLIQQMHSYPVIFHDETGNDGIGLYRVAYRNWDSYYLYIGNYVEESRNGYGIWMTLDYLQNYQYRFEGNWENDRPNGAGESFSLSLSSTPPEEVVLTGSLIDGIWDGEVISKTKGSKNVQGDIFSTHTLHIFSKGKYVALGDLAEWETKDPVLYPIGKDMNTGQFHMFCPPDSQVFSRVEGIEGCF